MGPEWTGDTGPESVGCIRRGSAEEILPQFYQTQRIRERWAQPPVLPPLCLIRKSFQSRLNFGLLIT